MLSFESDESRKSFPIAHGFDNKAFLGKPIFTVYFINDYSKSSQPEIISNNPRELLDNERFRIMKEFALSKIEFNTLLDRVVKNQPVIETSSRTLKRAYLEISRILNEKLKTTLEFDAKEDVFIQPIFDTTKDRQNNILTCFGPSGCGKSYAVNSLLVNNPAVVTELVPSIILFSSVGDDDPSYKPIKNMYGEKFFWVDPKDMKPEDLDVRSYQPKTIMIFDDVDSIANKIVRKQTLAFRNRLLEVARHNSYVVISTTHLFHARTHTQKVRNSSKYFMLYPRAGSKGLDDVLENKFNIQRHERIDLLKKLKREARGQFVHVDNPAYIVNTKRVQLF